MIRIKTIKFKSYGNKKIGFLIPFYLEKHFKNFKLKRFFIINGNNKSIRADHAHRKCEQVFIAINGTTKIEVISQKEKKENFIISEKNKTFLRVPKLHWVKIKFMDKKASILVLCNYKYDKKEYILNKKKFFEFKIL